MKKIGVVMGSDSDLPVVEKAIDTLKAAGENPYIIGKIVTGEEKIKFI